MIGHRMSSLPVTQFCGQSPVLREQYCGTAERAAIQSSFFHAVCAKRAEEAARLRPQLTDEELEEVAEWRKPEPITLYDGAITLAYEDAQTEWEVMIAEDGEATDDPDKALTIGHVDFFWRRLYQRQSVIFVGDIKRSAWTVTNPNSLQLMAYGWALSKAFGADAFVPGLWAAQEGRWSWGEWQSMAVFDTLDLWERIRHAASNKGPASTGPHCRNCFARMHCKEFLFPSSERSTGAMSAFVEGNEPTTETVADAVLWAQSMQDVAKQILDNAKEYARRGNKVSTADGRSWSVAMRNGRETADVKRLRAELGPEAEKYIKRGEPFPFPTWSSR